MTNETPTYWSIDADTYTTWVAVLGNAAAGKLMAACAAYFFDGTEPDQFKLTKQARALFEGERGRMERRRASAVNGRRGGRSTAPEDVQNPVDNRKSSGKPSKNSRRSSGKVAEKSAKNQAPAQASTSGNAKSRLAPILNLNPSHNPQTPAPSAGGAGSGGRGSGLVSPAEFADLRAAIGYNSPTAYGVEVSA